MRFVAALGGIPFVLVCLAIGPRLLLLARRTGALPELVMGCSLLLMGGIGYPLTSVARQAVGLSDSARTGFMIAAHVCMVSGAFSMSVFNWRVFRADARWARALTFGTALLLVALFLAQGYAPGFSAGALRGEGLPLVLINLVVAGTPAGRCSSPSPIGGSSRCGGASGSATRWSRTACGSGRWRWAGPRRSRSGRPSSTPSASTPPRRRRARS
jgi:hypothetical protein